MTLQFIPTEISLIIISFQKLAQSAQLLKKKKKNQKPTQNISQITEMIAPGISKEE